MGAARHAAPTIRRQQEKKLPGFAPSFERDQIEAGNRGATKKKAHGGGTVGKDHFKRVEREKN
jgi:hypothetical protein